MATIREIAELAGVSRGTVDRVLNHRGSVNPATAALINEIARKLDYKPNRAGMALAAQRKNLKLGVLLFDAGTRYFEDVWKGVEQKAEELTCYNCTVLKEKTAFSAAAQHKALLALQDQGIDGLVLTPFNDPAIARQIDRLAEAGIPVITTNTDIRNSRRLAFVGSDFYRCGQTAAGLMRLMTFGETNVGIITGSSQVLCHTDRIRGFRDNIAERYPQIRVVDTIENSDDEFESYEKTLALLKRYPQINALYFTAGGVYGGCRAALTAGRGGIRIIAYDNVPTTAELIRRDVICAAICQQPEVQGALPLQLLFDYLATGQQPEKEFYYTAVDIRIRENL